MPKLPSDWWRTAVFYAIWPRSFKDGNGDGIGDIQGIISKLDYLQSLGVTGVWLSPIFVSPKKDQGYDVSDYMAISPEFGTMEDVERMLSEGLKRGIRFIFDLVVNHSSEEHPWFLASKRDDPKYRDYYIWRKGRGAEGRELPNNWGSIFGTPAWTWVEERKEFYFHMFSKEQPDLNLENEEVLAELEKIVRFWTQKGVAGFRLDAAAHFAKPADFPDYPGGGSNIIGDMHFNNPQFHPIQRRLNQIIKGANPEALILSEIAGVQAKEFDLSSDPDRKEADMIIVFEHMMADTDYDKYIGKFKVSPFNLLTFKSVFSDWFRETKKGWINLYLGNLDQPRIISRYGDEGRFRVQSGKMLATFYHTLKGTPFIFQGEEIGMVNWKFRPEEADDIEFKGFYKKLVTDMQLFTEAEYMQLAHKRARDTARTPVQWSAERHGGFTDGPKTWIGMPDNYAEINAEASVADPHSVFHHYRKLIALRKSDQTIVYGDFQMAFEKDASVFAFWRVLEGSAHKVLVVCNFFKELTVVNLADGLPGERPAEWTVLLSNYPDMHVAHGILKLREFEAIVFKVPVGGEKPEKQSN